MVRLPNSFYSCDEHTKCNKMIEIAFSAIVYCFNTKVLGGLKQEASKQNISVRFHNVIYRLIDDLKDEINKNLPMISVEEEIGA